MILRRLSAAITQPHTVRQHTEARPPASSTAPLEKMPQASAPSPMSSPRRLRADPLLSPAPKGWQDSSGAEEWPQWH